MYTCNNGCVVLYYAELHHVALGPGPDFQLGDGDLVRVLIQAQHHRVHGVRGQGGDCVRIHLVVHLNVKNDNNNIYLEPILSDQI